MNNMFLRNLKVIKFMYENEKSTLDLYFSQSFSRKYNIDLRYSKIEKYEKNFS